MVIFIIFIKLIIIIIIMLIIVIATADGLWRAAAALPAAAFSLNVGVVEMHICDCVRCWLCG